MIVAEPARRYRAFISYSQRDKRHATRLHKALESYRVPKGVTASGVDKEPRKLGRFFRDNEEMGAAADLGAALRGAIADSESLIVVCSPHAAQSKWVNEEVPRLQAFRPGAQHLRGHCRWRPEHRRCDDGVFSTGAPLCA